MSSILIVDGNSLMFRAYFATSFTGNLMQNSQGLYTNAVYGFINMMNKLLTQKPDYVFVAFDAGKKTFRHQSYDEYKGGRKPIPEEFRVQIPYIKRYLDCINVRHEEMLEFEADDLVATVSELALNNKVDEIMVVSGDKDLLQLVRGNVKVCLTKKGITELEEYTVDNFFDKMGFNPDQIPDYKGLVGDSSDNLPGIKGIGEKTALKLLGEFKTLENIVGNTSLLTGKTKTVIEEGAQTGLTCKKLATLVKDINIEFSLDDIKTKEINMEELVKLYNELEFKVFLSRLNGKSNIESNEETNASTGEVSSQLLEINEFVYNTFDKYDIDYLFDKEIVVIPEVFGDNYYNGEFLGISLVIENRTYFINNRDLEHSEKIKQILENCKKLITFDYKKLYVVLKRNNLNVNKPIFDMLLAIYLLDPKKASEDFKECVIDYNEYNLENSEDIYGKGAKAQIPDIDIVRKYAGKKAYILSKIWTKVLDKINEENVLELFNTEIGLSKVLGNMELTGLICSREELEKCKVELDIKKNEYEQKIYELAGEKFNINSPKQLGEILFDKLGLPTDNKRSTDAKVLEYLARDNEIAKVLLDYRKVAKIISTYINGLFDLMDGFDFIHPLYKQALTVTGRLSSVEPNIQNMPIRDDVGKVIRKAFVSRFDGGKIVSLDYSQIELRVLASMANDVNMIKAFNSDVDFHRATAAWIFDKDPADITSHERSSAKAINFGIVYGMSAWGLSETVGISPKEAKQYIEKYFMNHPGIDAFIKNTINQAKIEGYTKTLFNRKRYIPELKSMNKTIYQFGERTAINSPIQGTAADIIKMAMVSVGDYLEQNKLKSQLIAQVHDELVFDCVPEEIDSLIKNVKELMENVVKLSVRLIAESEIGDNWMEA